MTAILGDRLVTGVRLRSGAIIDCDAVVVAGDSSHARLALDTGIAVGRGIQVDGAMRISHLQIHAAGEGAGQGGVVHAPFAPEFE
jgi:nitrite reductase (NADH) large subunit